jgi:hypothetical protein
MRPTGDDSINNEQHEWVLPTTTIVVTGRLTRPGHLVHKTFSRLALLLRRVLKFSPARLTAPDSIEKRF